MDHLQKKSFATLAAAFVMALLLPLSAAHGQLTLNVAHASLDELSIGDIDFQHFTNNHLYFTMTIISSDSVRMVRIEATITINLANGSVFASPPAARLVTQSFQVSNLQPRVITNLDLGKNSTIKTQSFDYSQQAKDQIQKLALATGKVPAGTYTFNLSVIDENNPRVSASQVITLTLSNISRLDLISPTDGSAVPTPFPLLQWIYDGDSVEVSVYAYTSQQHSKEEAASGVPQLVVRSGDPGLPVGSRTFQYPTTAARPLQPGQNYVWKVQGLTGGSGGSGAVINSEIWEFTVASPNGQPDQQNVVNALQFLLGGNSNILSLLTSGNLQLTGVVMLDGHPVSAADIQRILNDLAANPDKIVHIDLVEE